MIDIYFVNSVINIIWYIFSILFVLYKFTSFFTYIYNFGKFLGKLTQNIFYVKDRVVEFTEQRRNQYITRPSQVSQVKSQSLFTRMKNNVTNYFWGPQKQETEMELPIYTRISDVSFKPQKRNKKEDLYFENHIKELMGPSKSNNNNSFMSIDLSQANTYDSNYESYYDTNCHTSDLFIKRKNEDPSRAKACFGLESNINETNDETNGETNGEICDERNGETSETNNETNNVTDDETNGEICDERNDEKELLINKNNSENVKERYNIQDSNMLFNSNFIRKVFNS